MKRLAPLRIIITRPAIFLLVLWALSAMPSKAAFAQDEEDPDLDLPCGGNDPYGEGCPLDTWVAVLAVGGLAFGAYNLHKRHIPTADVT